MPRSIKTSSTTPTNSLNGSDYHPEPGDERPVVEYLLQRVALARARSERQIVDAITAAVKNVPWQRIGELLGTSAQAAQQRYGNVISTLISRT